MGIPYYYEDEIKFENLQDCGIQQLSSYLSPTLYRNSINSFGIEMKYETAWTLTTTEKI